MIRRARNLHPPIKAGARNAEIAKAAFDELDDFIAPANRLNKFTILAKRQQPILIF